jgi:outer membrane receptor protein involved in Fe transport
MISSHAQQSVESLKDSVRLTELPDVVVIGNSPLGSSGISLNQFAGNVQTINYSDLPKNVNNLADLLNESLGSVNLNDTQGNKNQVDLNYRGFTASPVLGTPQGVSVFMDGMRMNEPFGDVVSWDLIPRIAISNITMIPGSNPVYGLNTLGGALSVNTKSGFNFSGTNSVLGLGSFGEQLIQLESGGHGEYTDYYVAASLNKDHGWAQYNPSNVQQLYTKFGFQDEKRDIDLSLMYANNSMYGNQTVPLSMISDATAGYSHPDYTNTQSFAMNLKSSYDFSSNATLAGNFYARHIDRSIFNSNITDTTIPGNSSCIGSPENCNAENLLANYTQNIYGLNVQKIDRQKLFDVPQNLTWGLNYEISNTAFNNAGQSAYLDSTRGVIGVQDFMNQSQVGSVNKRVGLFFTDTLQINDVIALTGSARWDHANIELSGNSCISNLNYNNGLCDAASGANTWTAVSGNYSYQRLDPSIGLTYKTGDKNTLFASYSEGFRTPSAIELACADPSTPCNSVPNAFGADPYLKPVISKTYELGYRGETQSMFRWKTALFVSHLYDDIYFNQTNAVNGYFSNIGQTRREGVEFAISGNSTHFDYSLSTTYVDATFQSSFAVANSSNSNPNQLVQPGDKIPSIPALTTKLNLGYKPVADTRIYLNLQGQSSQYARGDENNADVNGQVPGFLVAKLGASHKFNPSTELSAVINNVTNQRYSNFGVLSTNNVVTGANEQFRSMSVPRSFFTSLRLMY